MLTLTLISLDMTVDGQSQPTTVYGDFPLSTEWITANRLTYKVDAQGITRYKKEYGQPIE
jgi:hypothetical protein